MKASVRSYRSAITNHLKQIIAIHQDRIDVEFRKNDSEGLLSVVDDGAFLSRLLVVLNIVMEAGDLAAHEACSDLCRKHYQNSYDKVKRLADQTLRSSCGAQNVSDFVSAHCARIHREMLLIGAILVDSKILTSDEQQNLWVLIDKHVEKPLTAYCESYGLPNSGASVNAVGLSAAFTREVEAKLKLYKDPLLSDWKAYLITNRCQTASCDVRSL